MTGLFLVSLGLLIYVYAGYPLLLWTFVRLRGARPLRKGDDLPRVSLVISAYNEAHVIQSKIENALALDYPAALLQIAVISDASTDATDAIVRRFAPRVELLRQSERRGKTAGLNRFVPTLTGDVVVFSDANAIYQPDAIRKLVRNFKDSDVGCVTGEARYTKGDQSVAGIGERVYWDYEIWIKRLETGVGSMVGGDGAIYAIRRGLWRSLPEHAINDFLNPLQIVAAGFRGVYEPEAVCYEETAGGTRREWRRRIRIVSRSWQAVFLAPATLNPARVGLFAFCLLSHKVLRWFSGLFIAAAAVASIALVMRMPAIGPEGLAAVALIAAALFAFIPQVRRSSGFIMYFTVINAASLVGLCRGTFGSVSGVWTTPREEPISAGRMLRPGLMVLAMACGAILYGTLRLVMGGVAAAPVVFWSAMSVLVYVYAGYPILLWLLAKLARRPVAAAGVEPRVCLLIAANNEESVIEDKVRNSLALDYPSDRLEILVASDGSHDKTNDIVRSFASRGVRLLAFPERRGKISAINEGMREIDAEVVVLSDANTFLRKDAIRALAGNFADAAVGAVSGDVVLTGDRAALAGSEDLYYRYERALQRLESEIGSLVGVDGALYAIRRELFVAPPADTILDDMAIPMAILRAGRRVVFEPSALAVEMGSSSSSEEFSRKSRVVAGAVQFLGRPDSGLRADDIQSIFSLVSHKALRWLSPAFAIMAFIASVMLAPTSAFFAAVLAVQLLVIAGGLVGCIPAVRRLTVVALAHYFCLVQAAAAVGFVRGLSGRQAVAWRRFSRVKVQTT
jgi:cellulose synthase/poly-beta-1,6-N-acetylglucosamine synthase-like glycosyltransferase